MRSSNFRRWPSAASGLLLLALMAGAPVSAQTVQEPPVYGSPEVNASEPYESWNRNVFVFNDTVDRWFLRPVAQTYRTVTPDLVDRGVTNFFNNLTEIRNFTNSLLQLKGEPAVVALGRLTYNTGFGPCGLYHLPLVFDLP